MLLCNYIFAYFLLYFILLIIDSRAMTTDEADEISSKSFIGKRISADKDKKPIAKTSFVPPRFPALPTELTRGIFDLLQRNDILNFRGTSKILKSVVDADYWNQHAVSIGAQPSLAIQDIESVPFSSLSLSFGKWEQQDIEKLLSFKYVRHLHLTGLKSWDFSTGKLFNPDPISSYCACILSFLNVGIFNIFGLDLGASTIFSNVISLDLSNSSIGDYGVISFVARFQKLETLNLTNNDIGRNQMGEIEAIANLKTLMSLNISKNHFSSETVKEIHQLTNLTSLDVSHNDIADTNVIKKLRQLPKLIHFTDNNQREQKSSTHPLPIFFSYPLLSRGRIPF